MAETDATVGIYGAVDRRVKADPVARAQVAQLIEQYQNPDLSWYDDFNGWLAETPESEGATPTLFPNLPDALDELGKTPPETSRTRARRMFAIAVASRAFPEMSKEDSPLRSLAVGALHQASLAGEGVDNAGAADGLYRLLAGEVPTVGPDTAEPRPTGS